MHPETEIFAQLLARALKIVRQMQSEQNPPAWAVKAAKALAAFNNTCCVGNCDQLCPTIVADARIIANAFHAEYGL
jgi:hypothetical protein